MLSFMLKLAHVSSALEYVSLFQLGGGGNIFIPIFPLLVASLAEQSLNTCVQTLGG